VGKLARALRIAFATELACYAVLFAVCAPSRGWLQTAGLALAIAVSLRAAPIVLSYAIALARASPVPPAHRAKLPALATSVLLEVAVTAFLYTVLMPFANGFQPSLRSARPFTGSTRPHVSGERSFFSNERPPVLLLHAYLCNAGSWWRLRRWLTARGHAVQALDLEPFADIDSYASVIAAQIDAICRQTGAPSVILIGHSMGGLAARAYLRAHGPRRVERVITLGSPHHGSVHAHLAPGQNGRQMRPGNAWLFALGTSEGGEFPVPVTSIYSCHDNFVAPQASSRLPGARTMPISGVGHLTLPFSRRVRQALAAALADQK
jgi:pimeloyl-ACP methyl ester carboxylesterase